MTQKGLGRVCIAAGLPAQQEGRVVTLQTHKHGGCRSLIATHRVVFDQGIALSRVLGPGQQEVGTTVSKILQTELITRATRAIHHRHKVKGDVACSRGCWFLELEAQRATAGILQREAQVGASLCLCLCLCLGGELPSNINTIEEQRHIRGHLVQAVALSRDQIRSEIEIVAQRITAAEAHPFSAIH